MFRLRERSISTLTLRNLFVSRLSQSESVINVSLLTLPKTTYLESFLILNFPNLFNNFKKLIRKRFIFEILIQRCNLHVTFSQHKTIVLLV